MSEISPFRKYWFSISRAERVALAGRAGTSEKHLNNVAYGYNKNVSEGMCMRVAAESGFKVKPWQIRPDFDWGYYRTALIQAGAPQQDATPADTRGATHA